MTEYIKLPAGVTEVEEFLDYCGVPYTEAGLIGKRIPLMLRFRFYLEAVELEGKITAESTEEECREAMRWSLEKAYKDVGADRTEKVAGGHSLASWAEGCFNTSACASCKSGCS
ncbi:MAG: Nitrogen fixation protein NifW [Paenibacillaceae bacterium]|jgi:hypothetical protein|nr:Nitrogen fixation protein NifW [Paenibacillaceae bacterium]